MSSTATTLASPSRPSSSLASPRQPPALFPKITVRQLMYIVLMHSLGAGLLDATINFVIAYAMYHNQEARLWNMPNTIAGDAAVTVLVQGILTWVIDGALTHQDCRKGTVAPIVLNDHRDYVKDESDNRSSVVADNVVPLKPRTSRRVFSRFVCWICAPSLDLFEPGVTPAVRFKRVLLSATRGLAFSLCVLPVAWCLGVGIACAAWPALARNEPITNWGPMIFKAVYTLVLGALTTPVSTVLAMTQAKPARGASGDPELADIRAADGRATALGTELAEMEKH
ncbi:hypothetical protein HDU86_007760 [Geranomyces michiganensis]|nr:hypothetical protein HDU86_007760 [Geranomyces michiganensis]